MPHKDTGHIEFEQMLRRSRSILYRICLAFTDRQPCNIDDLYQEIVCNLWRGWPQGVGVCFGSRKRAQIKKVHIAN